MRQKSHLARGLRTGITRVAAGRRWGASLEPSSPRQVPFGVSCEAGLGSGWLSALPSGLEEVGLLFSVRSLSQLFFATSD